MSVRWWVRITGVQTASAKEHPCLYREGKVVKHCVCCADDASATGWPFIVLLSSSPSSIFVALHCMSQRIITTNSSLLEAARTWAWSTSFQQAVLIISTLPALSMSPQSTHATVHVQLLSRELYSWFKKRFCSYLPIRALRLSSSVSRETVKPRQKEGDRKNDKEGNLRATMSLEAGGVHFELCHGPSSTCACQYPREFSSRRPGEKQESINFRFWWAPIAQANGEVDELFLGLCRKGLLLWYKLW